MSAGSDPEGRLALAEDRTEAAYDRTRLAYERTFAAWVRTGLASAAAGFGLLKLMQPTGPDWLVRGLAATFVTLGAAMFAFGLWSRRRHGVPKAAIVVLGVLLVLGTLAALVLIPRA